VTYSDPADVLHEARKSFGQRTPYGNMQLQRAEIASDRAKRSGELRGEPTYPRNQPEGYPAPGGFKGGGWIGPARERMEKKGTVGALHKQLGVASGNKIPASKLSAAKARAKRTGNTQLMRRVTFAQNVRK
jgi:hypothetical protein